MSETILKVTLHDAIQDCCFRDGTIASWLRSPKEVEEHLYAKLSAAGILVERKDLKELIDDAQENCNERSVNVASCLTEYNALRRKYGLEESKW